MTGDEFVPCKDGYVIPHMPEDVPAGRAHVSRVMTGVVGDEWARNVGWMVSDYKEGLLGKSSSRQQGLTSRPSGRLTASRSSPAVRKMGN